VENLVIKYAPDLPAVLHGVSFRIKAGERVGLVGRTGSGKLEIIRHWQIEDYFAIINPLLLPGKSTLATALLRFVEPTKGRIMLDGIDITKIGLYDLRSRMVGHLAFE
jgi:ABC-type multidrug transport system fused ATPase/permease subunit